MIRNHVPTSIIRYPENIIYFTQLCYYKFLDPYLREFLFKLYHCRLIFKRYKLNINDLLNFGEKCILCQNAIDTPKHLFNVCDKGSLLREKRNHILRLMNFDIAHSDNEQRTYNFFKNDLASNKTILFIMCVCNYSMYRMKLKKIYDPGYSVSLEEAMFSFIRRIQLRIICDHQRLRYPDFKKIWDTENTQNLFSHNSKSISNWKF